MQYVDAKKILPQDKTLDTIKDVLSTLPVGQACEIQKLPIDKKVLTQWQNAIKYYGKTNNISFSIIKDKHSYWIIRKG
jgi:hypothetical protein